MSRDRRAGGGLAEKRQSGASDFGTEGLFVSAVHFKKGCGVLDLDGRLNDRNRQRPECAGPMPGKILKSSAILRSLCTGQL